MPLFLTTNGVWPGFIDKTDGIHIGAFQMLLEKAFDTPIQYTQNHDEADILLESYFAPSILSRRPWKYSIFFSGEASLPLPAQLDEYTLILGPKHCDKAIPCPLLLLYDICKPFDYSSLKGPSAKERQNSLCSVISSSVDHESRYRFQFLQTCEQAGLPIVFGGHYKNSLGYTIPGQWHEEPLQEFYRQHKFVLCMENTETPYYNTEKCLTAIRAGAIPVYYGSQTLFEYVSRDRVIYVDKDAPDVAIKQIRELLETPSLYENLWTNSLFTAPLEIHIERIVSEIKKQLFAYDTCVLANLAKESERLQTLKPILDIFKVSPSSTTWSDTVVSHPWVSWFLPRINSAGRSLAINTVTAIETHVDKNRYLVVFESDAIPNGELQDIKRAIERTICEMCIYGIDYANLGTGCLTTPSRDNMITPTLKPIRSTRCTEAYILSPKFQKRYMNYWYSQKQHNTIDWDFNEFFQYDPTISVVWHLPELFYQGSYKNIYPSNIPI